MELNIEKQLLTLSGSKAKYKLRVDFDKLGDFKLPDIDQKNLATLDIKPADLINSIKAANISVGLPQNVYEPRFLSICISLDKQDQTTYVVSTDRYRITKNTLPESKIESEIDTIQNFLLPPKNLQIFISAIDDKLDSITINFGKDYAVVTTDSQTIGMRYGEGDYPDYTKIIPQSFACNFKVNTAELNLALKQASFCAKQNTINKSVDIQIKPESKEMTLVAKADDGSQSTSTCLFEDYEGHTEPWNQAFNIDYLLDYIKGLKSETVLWEANPGKPSVLSPDGEKDKQLYLASGLR